MKENNRIHFPVRNHRSETGRPLNLVIHTRHPGRMRMIIQKLVEIEHLDAGYLGIVESYVSGSYDAAIVIEEQRIKKGEVL